MRSQAQLLVIALPLLVAAAALAAAPGAGTPGEDDGSLAAAPTDSSPPAIVEQAAQESSGILTLVPEDTPAAQHQTEPPQPPVPPAPPATKYAPQPPEQPAKGPVKIVVPDEIFEIPEELEPCAANLRKISAALKKYEKDKGKLPDWLSDLVPDYLDKELLLCPIARREQASYFVDPKLPCSYTYEFSPTRLSEDWQVVGGMTCREWKTLQVGMFGDIVPVARCGHGERRLSASVGGKVYLTPVVWETVFLPTYRRGDELAYRSPGSEPLRTALDPFDGKLALDWQVRHADPTHISLSKPEGALTITTQPGGFYGGSTSYKNLFVIENPVPASGNFELTTCLVGFKPSAGFQQAGLICMNDVDNYVKWVNESGDSGTQRMALIRETKGACEHAYAPAMPEAERLWLRLQKVGNNYLFSTSADGEYFWLHGELPWGDGAPKYLGLVAKNSNGSGAPEIDASFDFFEVREVREFKRPADRYALPTGGSEVLLRFIEDLRQGPPQSITEAAEYRQKARGAMLEAARRIVDVEKDEWSPAYQVGLRLLLEERVRAIPDAPPAAQQQTLEFIETLLKAKAERAIEPEDADLALATGWALESAGQRELAARGYADFVNLLAEAKGKSLAERRELLEGAVRRLDLKEKPLDLAGAAVDGSAFRWPAYRGKVVAVCFWASDSEPSRLLLESLKLNHRLYGQRGFDVVGISIDGDRNALAEFLDKAQLPWVTLHDKKAKRYQPPAVEFGVWQAPVALLVDKEGKVVSLNAQGSELDRLLEELLGPPYVPQGELTCLELASKSNQKLDEGFGTIGRPNDLAELPRGEQTFGGVKFHVADSVVHLASGARPELPAEVDGIPVDRNAARLYMLHGAQWGSPPDGTTIASYRVNYADGTSALVPVVLGEDVRDWWNNDQSRPVSRGKVVWAGQNAASRSSGAYLRLYLAAWDNPHPEKKIASIDLLSAPQRVAALFCVAITAEAPASK